MTPPKGGGSFTPNKMLLMNSERRMNMLSPLRGEKLYNADIETGKILNEWSFKKDGQEVAMKVIPTFCRFNQRSRSLRRRFWQWRSRRKSQIYRLYGLYSSFDHKPLALAMLHPSPPLDPCRGMVIFQICLSVSSMCYVKGQPLKMPKLKTPHQHPALGEQK